MPTTELPSKLIHRAIHTTVIIRELVETVVSHLVGAYALAFKSTHFPGECVVACCGSPLILGINAKKIISGALPVTIGSGARGMESKSITLF